MLTLRLQPSVALLLTSLVLGLPAAGAQELKERDHQGLGKLIHKYLDKKSDAEDQIELRDDLLKSLGKIGKKRVEKDEDPVQGALALTADLGRALFLSHGYKKVHGGKVFEGEIEVGEALIAYSAWVPKSYKQTEATPLLLCVPGMADGGVPMAPDQFLIEYWTEADARDGAIVAAVGMPTDTGAWEDLASEDGQPGGVHCIMATLRELRETYAVDPDRVYLVGRGQGVAAAMSLASKFPHLFAGVVGQGGDVGGVEWQNFRNLPTFLQGGGAEATAFSQAIEAEYKNCTEQADAEAADIWAWMQQNPRKANPTVVTLRPGTPIPNKAYWIEVPATDASDVTIRAEINRATNTITVTGEGIEAVTIYFNDLLVDLDQPVKVILNGREQEALIPRSVDEMLALIVRGTSDSGKLYVARRVYDISG